MTNLPLNDLFSLSTPEEKLMILRSEITTPIEIIRGNITLIKKQISQMGNQELIGYVEAIEKAAERLKLLRNAIR